MSDAPARYTPWMKGIYEVTPNLKPLGFDFGNGEADHKVFQIDSDRDRYRQSKREALSERPSKYIQRHNLNPGVEIAVLEWFGQRLSIEYPDRFGVQTGARGRMLCGEGGKIPLDPSLRSRSGKNLAIPPLERLALAIQEDFCVASVEEGRNWNSYIHLCSPAHWAAEDKIGRSFYEAHKPVPGFDRVNQASSLMIETLINKGPYVRFVWGVESDCRLNHHPDPPPGWSPQAWWGRDFAKGKFWVRTERQVLWGLPHVNALLFTIRTGFIPSDEILTNFALKLPLKKALESMNPASRKYKGLDLGWNQLMRIFDQDSIVTVK